MKIRSILAATAVASAPLAAAGFATAARASVLPAAATTATSVTKITQHLDPGFNGDNWATDTITRKATVTLVGKDSNTSDCGNEISACYTYTGTIRDTGTAVGIAGHASPGALDRPIKGSPSARIAGLASVTFHASSNAPSGRLVPATMTGNPVSSDNWVEQFFPQGTSFGSGPYLPTWAWFYKDSAHCQTWVDAYNIGKADSGDITGVNQCPVVTDGKTSADGTRATVTWKSTKTSTFVVTLTGPGPLSGRVSHVSRPEAVYPEGLIPGHTYELKIQPLVNGAAAGKAGKVTFITRKG